jgi:hypothetical protein
VGADQELAWRKSGDAWEPEVEEEEGDEQEWFKEEADGTVTIKCDDASRERNR